MLKQELELVFIKALSAGEVSSACYRHLVATFGKKRPTSTGKRKVAELACASDGSEPATRRLATGSGPASEQHQGEGHLRRPTDRVPQERDIIRRCGSYPLSPTSQVGRSSPQPRVRTRPSLLSPQGQLQSACLMA
jgi:hypothetical protein